VATGSAVVRRTAPGLDVLRVHPRDVLRGVFALVHQGVDAATVPRMTGVPVAGVGVVLVRPAVAVRAMPVVMTVTMLFVPAVLRHVTSAGVMHGAASGVPFRVPGLRQLLMLVDRTAV
jgi:hypothetical protein